MAETPEETKAKEELLKRLREKNLTGIEELLEKIEHGSVLCLSFRRDLDPKTVDQFYDIVKEHYKNRDGCSYVISLCETFQKKHRKKYQLELETEKE